ncbi:MAG: hypothetical protein ABH835_03330 [Patescibacteria group bacterium]
MEEQKKPVEEKMTFDPKDVEENKAIACLSYLGILFLIPLLAKKDSKFAQTHAKQGLVMAIAAVLVVIPFVGWVWGLIVIIVDIIAIVKTLQGEYWKIPGANNIAKKFNF